MNIPLNQIKCIYLPFKCTYYKYILTIIEKLDSQKSISNI